MSRPVSIVTDSDAPSKRPPTPAKDLEYGRLQRSFTPQHPDSVSSKSSSLPTANDPPALAWNTEHPCYPHPNTHVPFSSPLQGSTRLIRIPRDYMAPSSHIAPQFSNTYPEILEPWVSEADFRTLIKGVNQRLFSAYNPYAWASWLDLLISIATGWFWESLGMTHTKRRLKGLEAYVDEWNGAIEKGEDGDLVKAVALRRSAYGHLDIQIPDPKVGFVEDE